MPSYQEIETRLQVVEDKLDHFMKNFKIGVKSRITGEVMQRSMLDLYHEAKQIQHLEER